MKSIKLSLIALSFFVSSASFAYITASPSYVSFGQVKAGSYGSIPRTINVQNQNDQVVSMYVTPSCGMEFRVSGGCSGQVYPHSSCFFNVDYAPMYAGYHSCTISIRDSVGDYQSVTVSGSAQ
jgi:hypothetical protein